MARGALVTHAVAVIDRGQGGVAQRAAEGIELRALFALDELRGA